MLGGERLSPDASQRQRATSVPIATERAGLDGRYRKPVPTGLS